MLKTTTICHLVKPEDLNHHETLFAGRMTEWLVEACFIAAARLAGSTSAVHCVQIHDLLFQRPLHAGDIVEICARVDHLGRRTITVHGAARIGEQTETTVTTLITFVTVGDSGKAYEHGFVLPTAYVDANREICAEASRVVEARHRGEAP